MDHPLTSQGEPDALVVGAGPTGLALAAQLHALGAGVRIIDRQLDRAHESRALAVQPRTLEVLRGLGIAQTLVERGNDAARIQIHAGERVVSVRLFDVGLEDTAYPFLLFISQAETEAVLNEHLVERGLQVERGIELVAFEQGEKDVVCSLRHEDESTERLHARYLVGCDGAHSSVRHAAGIPFEGAAYPQTFVLADLEVDGGLDRDVPHAFLGARGMLFLFPLATPATWRMLGMRPAGTNEREQERAQPSLDELQALADAFTGGTLRLRDPVWRTYFRLHHRHAARYRAGRVFLAGDAAHVHSPAVSAQRATGENGSACPPSGSAAREHELPQHCVGGNRLRRADAAGERLTNLQEKSNPVADLGAERLAHVQALFVVAPETKDVRLQVFHGASRTQTGDLLGAISASVFALSRHASP